MNPATSASAAGDLNRAGCAFCPDARAFGLRVRRSRVGRAACGVQSGHAAFRGGGRLRARRARPQRLAGIREVPIPEAAPVTSSQAEVSLEALLLSPSSTPFFPRFPCPSAPTSSRSRPLATASVGFRWSIARSAAPCPGSVVSEPGVAFSLLSVPAPRLWPQIRAVVRATGLIRLGSHRRCCCPPCLLVLALLPLIMGLRPLRSLC